jgi:uncharacterized protein YjiK
MLGGSDSPKVGQPTVSGAKVVGKILAQDKHRKVLHFRKEKEPEVIIFFKNTIATINETKKRIIIVLSPTDLFFHQSGTHSVTLILFTASISSLVVTPGLFA